MPATPRHAIPSNAREKQQSRDQKERQWYLTRRAVMERDGNRCRLCGARKALDAHHIVRRSAGGGNEIDNLLALCRPCHDDVHAYRVALAGTAGKLKVDR